MSIGLSPEIAIRTEEEGLFSRDLDGRLVRMDKVTAADLDRDVTIKIDGRPVTVKKAVPATDAQGNYLKDEQGRVIPRATTIYDAALQIFATGTIGVGGMVANPIPILCHTPHMDPVAVCRICVVEISKVKRGKMQAERKLLPACQHRVEDTMEVATMATSEKVRRTVGTVTELLMTDHPTPCVKQAQSGDCELENLAQQFAIPAPRFGRREPKPKDDSSLVIAVDHDACILCDRCVRACNDIRDNQVIGRAGKGFTTHIAFDLDDPMGNSSCVACGECMISCPTGALTNKAVVSSKPWEDASPPAESIYPEELIRHPIPEIRRAFRGATPAFLRWNIGSIVRRRFKKGDVICREGEFGSTAFLIESGSVDIYLNTSLKHTRSRRGNGLFGLVKKFTVDLVSRDDDHRDGDADGRFIAIDAPVALNSARPVASLAPGDVFGEMTCMNAYPRSATVRAAEDTVVLELLRNVLYIMQRNKTFRAALEKKYRARAISNHLQSVGIFAPIRNDPEEFARFVDSLRDTVKLARRDPGDVIFRQGDRSDDGFYLVRTGFVKVSQKRPGGDHVLNYVGPGGYFGEIALMSDVPEVRALAPPGLRTASCTALDHVDLVQITAADFRDLLARFPKVREPLVREAIKRLEENAKAQRRAETMPLGEFLSQGLMNANSLLVLDLEKCTRCDECTKACSDTHDGVTRLIREGLRFDKFLVASSCRSCLDPYCLVGCPVGSIGRKDTLEILIQDWCIGCGKCAENCPYGNINMHPFPTGEKVPDPDRAGKMMAVVQQKATTCDLCHSAGGDPSCVYACPHDAAHRMTGRELIGLVERGHSS